MNLEDKKEMYEKRLREIEKQIQEKNKEYKGEPKFYLFAQNNSGGYFIENENVCGYVFIEANSAEHANALADNFGIYFNGCRDGMDCSCCGDRWAEVNEEDGLTEPKIYGVPVKETYAEDYRKECIIHYLDGHKHHIIFKTYKDCPGHVWERPYNIGDKCKICHEWKEQLIKKGALK